MFPPPIAHPSSRIVKTLVMYALCLADFFNLDLWPSGRSPNQADLATGFSSLASAALTAAPLVRDLTIRLYGGWHGDVRRTRVHIRPLTTRAIQHVPHNIAGLRFRFELAETPVWDRSLQLLGTVRRSTPGLLVASDDDDLSLQCWPSPATFQRWLC